MSEGLAIGASHIQVSSFKINESKGLFEIKADIKILLEDKAAKTEQIRSLERATFGKVTESEDNAYNDEQKRHFFNMIFDKTKTLQYKNQEFIYT